MPRLPTALLTAPLLALLASTGCLRDNGNTDPNGAAQLQTREEQQRNAEIFLTHQ